MNHLRIRKYFPKQFFSIAQLFLSIYLIVLSYFSLFRLILLFVGRENLGDSSVSLIPQACIIGLRFDIVISSYILTLPFILLTICGYFSVLGKKVLDAVFYYLLLMFSIAFIIGICDIPYFMQFFSRFSIMAFEWMNTPDFVIKMILQESSYRLYILLSVLILLSFFFIFRSVWKKKDLKSVTYKDSASYQVIYISFSLFFITLMLLGIRGRMEKKSPIREGTAYFSNNAFLNQLGLNPNFTLLKSYLDNKKSANKEIKLMDGREALDNVRNYLQILNDSIADNHPLERKRNPLTPEIPHFQKQNVVLVLMESMSAGKMQRHGNNMNLTPFLDSLCGEGYYFENHYSAGIHTFNGIFSTLFSYPAIFMRHHMKGTNLRKYNGLSQSLKENGYQTIYFTTHDGQFDNVKGFLKHNDFDYFVEKDDYPEKEVKTTLGVPDDVMFRYSMPHLKRLYDKGDPFLAVYMTASDHTPYYIPEYFTAKSSDMKNMIVEYADYSLQQLMEEAKKQEWYENTLFVFIADHGNTINTVYDLSLNYNHTPLLFYSPSKLTEAKIFSEMAGQIDVFPSIMGLLQLPYVNSTMGIDLFNDVDRPYIFFNADDKFGVIDDEWLLIVRLDNRVSLHKYRDKDLTDYASQYPHRVSNMQKYGQSHIQAFQFLLNEVIR